MKKKSLRHRREIAGWFFILPWLAGLIIFFLQPLLSILWYSFTKFVFDDSGYTLTVLSGGIFENYKNAITGDSQFPRLLIESVVSLVYQVPTVVFFCLFTALQLQKKFRGRTAMRTIYFLPIIITSGVIAEIIRRDASDIALAAVNSSTSNLFDVSTLTQQLLEGGMPQGITGFLTGSVANVADLVWKSGIQILVFLAALLAVPPTYYEVAQVEGASGWETFWKVTFPVVSPFVLVNLVYTIVDSFTDYSNGVMRYITSYFIKDMNYSYASAMAWIYFLVMLVVLGIVFLVSRKMVFYNNK